MLDIDPFILVFLLGSMVIFGAVIMHFQACANQIRKKRIENMSLTNALDKKLKDLEREIVDIQMEIEKIDEEINLM